MSDVMNAVAFFGIVGFSIGALILWKYLVNKI